MILAICWNSLSLSLSLLPHGYIHIQRYTHIHIYIYIYIHADMNTYLFMCVCVYIYKYIDAYMWASPFFAGQDGDINVEKDPALLEDLENKARRQPLTSQVCPTSWPFANLYPEMKRLGCVGHHV